MTSWRRFSPALPPIKMRLPWDARPSFSRRGFESRTGHSFVKHDQVMELVDIRRSERRAPWNPVSFPSWPSGSLMKNLWR